MESKRDLLDALAVLFQYPQGDFAERVARCRALADARSLTPLAPLSQPTPTQPGEGGTDPEPRSGRGDALASLEERARGMSRGEVEEMFTRTFEINPVCALEVGWHVYGEEYARGALMVRLREELRRHEIPEITELPDHLLHVLQLLGRLEPEMADDLAGRYVLPALERMIEAVKDKDCPYTELLEMTRDIVYDEFDPIEVEEIVRRTAPPESKRRLPVLQQPTSMQSCGAGCAPFELTAWEAGHGA